jgi:hypothetical protein
MKGGAEADSPATEVMAGLKESVLNQTSYVFITNPGETDADKLMCRVKYNGSGEYEMLVSKLETIINGLVSESTQSDVQMQPTIPSDESVFKKQLRLNMKLKSIDASEELQRVLSQHPPVDSSWIGSKEYMITDLFTGSE